MSLYPDNILQVTLSESITFSQTCVSGNQDGVKVTFSVGQRTAEQNYRSDHKAGLKAWIVH